MSNFRNRFRPLEWEPDMGPTDPISGGATSIVAVIGTTIGGFADLPVETLKILGVHPNAKKGKDKEKKTDSKAGQSTTTLASSSSASPLSTENLSIASDTAASETRSQQYLASEDSHSIADTTGSGTSGSTRLAPTVSSDDGASMTTVTSASSDRTIGTESIISSPGQQQKDHRGRSSSMADALHSLPNNSRPHSPGSGRISPSPSRPSARTAGSSTSTFVPTTFKPEAALDTVYGTGKGLSKIIGAGLKSPMDFTMAITKGFHNVPRLYGEEPRHIPRVTGIQSGLRTAGKEFGVGLFDGISGLVTQPISGAKQGGAGGFLKGVGRGIAGVVVKPSAAAYALPAYAMMGVYKEIQKRLGENVDSYIIAARVAQGYGEWLETDETTRRDMIHLWAERLSEVKGKRGLGKKSDAGPGASLGAIKTFVDKRKEKRQNKFLPERDNMDEYSSPLTPAHSRVHQPPEARSGGIIMSDSTNMAPSSHLGHESEAADAELEEAIRLSLRVEQQEPDAAGISSHETSEDAELRKAMAASLEQMKLVDEQDEEKEFNRAIAESAQHHAQNRALWERGAKGPNAVAVIKEDDEDEELKLALAESTKLATGQPSSSSAHAGPSSSAPLAAASAEIRSSDSDADLAKALEESKRHEEEEKKRQHEEDTVLEYVRKQSLAEEEYRRQHQQGKS
jgi:hypothetical protein